MFLKMQVLFFLSKIKLRPTKEILKISYLQNLSNCSYTHAQNVLEAVKKIESRAVKA